MPWDQKQNLFVFNTEAPALSICTCEMNKILSICSTCEMNKIFIIYAVLTKWIEWINCYKFKNSPKTCSVTKGRSKIQRKNQEILKIIKISQGLGQREKGLMIHLEEKMRQEGPRDRKAPTEKLYLSRSGSPICWHSNIAGAGGHQGPHSRKSAYNFGLPPECNY